MFIILRRNEKLSKKIIRENALLIINAVIRNQRNKIEKKDTIKTSVQELIKIIKFNDVKKSSLKKIKKVIKRVFINKKSRDVIMKEVTDEKNIQNTIIEETSLFFSFNITFNEKRVSFSFNFTI